MTAQSMRNPWATKLIWEYLNVLIHNLQSANEMQSENQSQTETEILFQSLDSNLLPDAFFYQDP